VGEAISNAVTNTMQNMGYWGICLWMLAENLFPPIPSELIMPLAGFTAAKGTLQLPGVIFAGVLGSVLGAFPWYYLGKLVSEDRMRHWADRYGKWFTITGKEIDRANQFFQKNEVKAVLLGRLVPGIRTIISMPAGVAEMPMPAFLLFTTLGTTIWVSFLTGLGYVLGDRYELVDEYLGPLSKVVAALLVVSFAVWVYRRKQKKQRRL
jgi:membrane protein DedA with SNARE-associated domain